MNSQIAAETVYFEKAEFIADYGSVIFLTVVLPSASGGMLRSESHVFVEQSEQHLHEIVFRFCDDPDQDEQLAPAVHHTHQLLADARASNPHLAPLPLHYRNTPLADWPFGRWRSEGRFKQVLDMLPGITASKQLRDALLGEVGGLRQQAPHRFHRR